MSTIIETERRLVSVIVPVSLFMGKSSHGTTTIVAARRTLRQLKEVPGTTRIANSGTIRHVDVRNIFCDTTLRAVIPTTERDGRRGKAIERN